MTNIEKLEIIIKTLVKMIKINFPCLLIGIVLFILTLMLITKITKNKSWLRNIINELK